MCVCVSECVTPVCSTAQHGAAHAPTMLSRASRSRVLQSVSSEGSSGMSRSRLHWRAAATIELTMGGPRASLSRRPL